MYGDPARWMIFRFQKDEWILVPPNDADYAARSFPNFSTARQEFLSQLECM